MIFGVAGRKVNAARSKIATVTSLVLLTSLFVSIPIPAQAAECVKTSTTIGGETVLTFSTVGTCEWTVPANVTSARVLVVGGGGSGGGGVSGSWFGAGGGGGAVVENQSFSVTPGAAISVVVGDGGAESDYGKTYTGPELLEHHGSSSSFSTLSAGGGKTPINSSSGDGGESGNGLAGGSGAGGAWGNGGAGAGAAGSAQNPGAGITSNISGTSLEYGGGGNGNYGGSTGTARAGAGSTTGTTDIAALANRGGGGSQMPNTGYKGGKGGSGVVIVRYAFACNPTSTTAANGDAIVTFATVGNCAWQVPDGVTSIWTVAVGGGGAAGVGVSDRWWGAGGGGGQVTSQTISATPGAYLSVSVGAGGTTGDGSATSFGSVTANGGKTPLNTTAQGGTSGSGTAGGLGTTGTTIAGGGGGASKAGVGISAGEGLASSITGTAVEYGGGGNGYNSVGTAGTPRPGAGSYGVVALANRGGGGSQMSTSRGAGGTGVVIIRYAAPAECSPTSTAIGTDTVLTFATTGTCTWAPPANVTTFQLLVVGAGGGGGSSLGGGGGGGRVISQNSTTISQPATITVGAGGVGGVGSYGDTTNHGKTGGRSALVSGSVNILSLGGSGGNGRYSATNLNADGSLISTGYTGGGGAYPNTSTAYPSGSNVAVAGSGGSGFIGGAGSGNGGGGGGGAGGPGVARGDGSLSNASSGGIGVSSSITGTATYYGGGGGASWYGGSGGWTGVGGLGGGGRGAAGAGAGISGTANTGGGGGGGYDGVTGGNGGTGIVILRYGIPDGFSALSFNANGGTGSRTAMFAATGTSVTAPDGTGFANQGFEFNGWYTNAAGTSGTAYAAGAPVTVSSNTTLFAQWSRVPVPSCAAGVGDGGPGTSTTIAVTKAGNGCVGISYKVNNVTTVATFNYTGADQSWTVPANVTSATFYLIGAGGGGGRASFGGGGGGYATGSYAVTPGQVLTVIVGQGGGGVAAGAVSGLPGAYTPLTYGGGGRGGSYGGASALWYSSGGGRSAIRLSGASTDLVTAAGGGGGSYNQCGFGGGGTSGSPIPVSVNSGAGATQSAGGAGGNSVNGYPGTAGTAYQGGTSKDEGGGGGGGFYGGGGGGDNYGGGGGSSYIALLTGATTTAGANCGNAAVTSGLVYVVSYDANTATSGAVPSNGTVTVSGGTLTLASNSAGLVKTNYTFSGWNTAANGGGTTYAEGATTFKPSGDTTLYAQWNATVTYSVNGATGTAPTAVVTTGSASRTFNLNSGSGVTRSNLNFSGWNTKTDGSGIYYPGGSLYTAAGNVTLYAIFRPTYTYNANGATGGTVPNPTVGPVPGTGCIVDPGYTNCRVFSYTGSDQQFTLPSDIDTLKGIRVEVWGAGGGGSVAYYGDPGGGAGGYSKATLTTATTGEVLKIVVGQGGLVRDKTVKYGGGGPGGEGGQVGSSGGGYSGIFTGTTPLVVSGGGGGVSPGSAVNGTAGGGGGANQNGGQAGTAAVAGRGGTNSAGGAGATGNTDCPTTGSLSRNGSYLQGGASCNQANAEGGGGGGGGYYGGGGGTYQTAGGGPENGGGGGGSGYLDLTRGTLITATAGGNGVLSDFSYPNISSANYANNAGRGGKAYTNTTADNSGGNGLVTIQWSSPSVESPVANNTGSLVRTGYTFAGWNTAADGNGTNIAVGSAFPSSTSTTLYAAWTPSNANLTPNFKTDTNAPIGVLASTGYVINNVYAGTNNDLILTDYPDKIQIIASVPSGTLAITTTTNLTLPIGYQSALNTAAATISFVGNLADVNAALASLKYTAAATAVSTTITISASYGGLNGNYRYNPATGNSYSIGATALTWDNTFNPTTASSNCGVSFNNMCGYAAVPDSSAESLFIAEKLGLGWIGILDVVQGTFKYVSNAPNGGNVATFTQYQSGYSSSAISLNARIAYSNGTWLEAFAGQVTANPIYEFGGKGETPIFAALTRTIAIGALATTGTPALATTSDTGTSSSDKITNDNTPDINIGGLTVGATITLTATPASGTALTCTFVATTTTGTCTFPTMADGTYSITATQSLGGATTATSTALTNVRIDATRPTVALSSSQIVSGGSRTATPATPGITNQITVTFSESVSGLLISEITKAAASTGWTITTTSLTTSAITSVTFDVGNTTGAGGTAGTLILSIAEGVASDVAGNTNTATANNFVINTLIQLTLTNQYDPCCVIGGNNETIAQTTPGGAITLPGQGTLTRAGHTFAGWSLVTTGGNGAVLGATYTPTVPVKLYSSWTPNVYVVSYNANGGNGAPAATSQNFTFGGSALVPSARGTLTRTGYTFDGWSTTPVASGTIYSNPNDTVVGTTTKTYTPSASITFYAKWTAGTFAVTFDANGGTGTQITNMSITAGTAKALTTNTYTRAGYTFGGWNTLANGTGTAYANTASVTLFGNTTIYAQWIPVTAGIPTVAISGSAGNTQITVAVTAASLGTTSGPATSFVVTASPGGSTCTITSPATTCTFTGLTNGVAYTFTAIARNTTGNSVASAASASATPAPFVVTYSANGGTVETATANFNLGSPVTLPLPTRSGYTFAGWNDPAGTSVGINGVGYSPSASITLTAQWSAVSYSIFYNGNSSTSGTVPSTGTFAFGTSYSIVTKGNLAKSGYTFGGWTTAANGTGTIYANAVDSIASSTATYNSVGNLTLYAKWEAEVYTITYDTNGATGSASKSSDSFTFGGTALTMPTVGTMVKAGYTFAGWSETNSGAAVVTPYSPTQTRTLYAIWVGIQYLISYNVNGGTGSLDDVSYTTGATGVTLNDGATLTRIGYIFAGWKTSGGTTVTSPYVTSSNLTLNAIWTPKTVSIVYAKGLATTTTNFPTNTTTSFGTNFTLSANVDTTTVVVQDNYAFAGWLESVSGVTYKPGDSFRISTEATLTFTAQWIRLFEVTYNTNGGTFAAGDGVNDSDCGPSKLCADNFQITLNAEPSRVGFTFAGWVSQSGSNLAALALTNVTATNYVFYATWTANSYTITFNKGTGSEGNASSITGTHGEIVSLAPSTGYSLDGSIFSGWLIGTTTYAAGAFYTLGTHISPVTATAQYVNNTFKIFYNTNGATTGTAALTSAVVGASIVLNAATTFTKDGYDFDGWSDGTQKFAANSQATMGSANSTLVAQWKIKSPAAPTISSVTGTDGGATVVIAPGTGQGPATSYTVTSSPSGASCIIYAPATSCFISPLVNGTPYTFTVSATNSTGTTNGSTSSPITPVGKPEAPTGVTAIRGNGQATITFTAPVETGGAGVAITSYAVTAYDSNGNSVGSCSGSGTSYTCTGLTNGAAYTFKATASNASLTSDLSTASIAVTPATLPSVPVAVSVSSSTSGAATISITAPTSDGGTAITGYRITSSPTGATCTVGANATTYICTGLVDGTSYTYSVVATNAVGDSASAAVSTAFTTQGAASAPSTVSATAGDSKATVTFSGTSANGSTITGYTVQAYDTNGNAVDGSSCTVTTSATSGSCEVTGLSNGSEYTFKVIANSSANGSSVTSSASAPTASIIPATVPDAPSAIEVTAGTGKISVAWAEPASNGSPIISYTVQAYDSSNQPIAGATCTVNAPTRTCDVSANLTAGNNYTFKVTATSAAGTSAASAASTSISVNAVSSVPINVTAVASNASATVSWDPPVNINGSAITGYTATAYTASNTIAGTCTSNGTTETCVVNGLTNGVAYTFKVSATNGIGTSGLSTASSAVTPSTVPNAPAAVSVTVGDAEATVSFIEPDADGGSAITGFVVIASNGATVLGTTSSLKITGLTNGDSYTFTVKAINANGESVPASSSLVTPAKAPDAPSGVSVTAGTGKISVSWTAPASNGSAITSYTVQAYDSSDSPVIGATCVATAPAVTCDVSANLAAGSNYTFKVTATNVAGTSSPSDASSEAAINAAPSAPINVTAVASNASATVSWGVPVNINGSAITGYTATAYTAGNTVAGTCTSNVGTETCVINNLTNGVAYTFKVTATNGIGTSALSTASSAATPSTIPNAPTELSVAVGNEEATVSFTPPLNNGGSAVITYTVTANDGSTASGSSSPLKVTGLTNGTSYTFTVKATNINGDSEASTASSAATPVASSAPTVSSSAQPTGTPYAGSTLTSVVTFNGAPEPALTYQWKSCTSATDVTTCTIISGATSATYVPTSSDVNQFILVTVTATNIVDFLTINSAPTQVIKEAVTISGPSGAQSGTSGTSLSINFSASGGTPNYSYTVASGSLPSGLALDASTGQLSGTPTTAGSYTFTIRGTDAQSVTADITTSITIQADDSAALAAAAAAAAAQAAAQAAAAQAAAQAAAEAAAEAAAQAAAEAAYQAVLAEARRQAALVEAARIAAEAKALADKKAADEAARIAAEKAAAEAKALADKKAAEEAARIAAEAKALADKKAADEAARIAAEKAAAEAKALADKKAAEEAARIAAEKAAAEAKALADKKAAEEAARIAAEKAAAEAKALADKKAADEAARIAAEKAAAEAKALADKKAADEAARIAAEAAATAASQKAAADAAAKAAELVKSALEAQAVADKAAASVQQSLTELSTTAASKAVATVSAKKAYTDVAAAVTAAAAAAAKTTKAALSSTNTKAPVDIAINSLTSKTAAAQVLAQANAVAAAAKAAANKVAAQALVSATEAKNSANAAQKEAIEATKLVVNKQTLATQAVNQSKAASDVAAKATAEKIAAGDSVKGAYETLLKALNEKAALADQAAKTTSESARSEINQKIQELSQRIVAFEKSVEAAEVVLQDKNNLEAKAQENLATVNAQVTILNAEVVAIRADATRKSDLAIKAATVAAVASRVATEARAVAAKVPSKAVIESKPGNSSNKNSARATITGLKPGQKVKVTVNVKGK